MREALNLVDGHEIRESGSVPHSYFVEKTFHDIDEPLPQGFNPRLRGMVNPETYGFIRAVGDVVSPIDVEWEAMQ